MPELPEVETIKEQLAAKITGLTITGTTMYLEKVIAAPAPVRFSETIRGRAILGVNRRGKFLLFDLSGGHRLVVHLRMSGQLVYETADGPLPRHTHLVFHLDRGRLRLTDLRQFGRVWLVPAAEAQVKELARLGPEPLSNTFTGEYFLARLKQSRRRIKALLLDQEVVAGIGNIYADEALYVAGIHPARRASDLSVREGKALHRAIRDVLQEGIAHRGTSIRDYVDAAGEEGSHQYFLRVHNRAGRPCPKCGTRIEKIKLGGRGTYFCPCCQPL
ncbi:DNA-formamidopyrimidine glycosylase [Thermodesulfitimonas sp.]